MQTLVFNTTSKFVKLYNGKSEDEEIIVTFDNVPTVKVLDGYYEVMQKDEFDKSYPVMRVPINNTLMLIKK